MKAWAAAGRCGEEMFVQKDAKTAVLLIAGMRDNTCREYVIEALSRVNGVQEVNASVIRARTVVVYGPPCKATELIRAVIDAGYGATIDGGDDARC